MGAKVGKTTFSDEQELRALFAEIDLNNNGVIDKDELRVALNHYGLPSSEADIRKLMRVVDTDKSNDIDFNEFVVFMRSSNSVLLFGSPGRWVFLPMNATAENAGKTLLAGGIAGAVSRTAVAPFERLKIIFQTQGNPPQYTGIIQSLAKIGKEEGLMGYFKGNGVNVLRIFPTSAIQFFSYEKFKIFLYGNRELSPVERLWAGALAGMTASVATYPLDFIRAHLSIQKEKVYRGVYHGLTSVVKEQGFFALYRGLWPTLLGVVPYVGIDFAAYETFKGYIPRQPDGTVKRVYTLGCGALAGSIAQTIAYPLDLVRRRMQVQGFQQGGQKYSGVWDAFKTIYKNEGVLGFYRGLWPNYVKVVPAIGISFVVYEEMKLMLQIQAPKKAD